MWTKPRFFCLYTLRQAATCLSVELGNVVPSSSEGSKSSTAYGWFYSIFSLRVNGKEKEPYQVIKITVKGPSQAQIRRAIREAERKLKQKVEREVRRKTGKSVKWVTK